MPIVCTNATRQLLMHLGRITTGRPRDAAAALDGSLPVDPAALDGSPPGDAASALDGSLPVDPPALDAAYVHRHSTRPPADQQCASAATHGASSAPARKVAISSP